MLPSRSMGPLLMAVFVTACATSGGSGVRRDPNLITAEEVTTVGSEAMSAYDAVQRLRPRWLTSRGNTTSGLAADRLPAVMLNSTRHSVDILRSLRAIDVASMRYVSRTDATTRYGLGYINGLIEVVMAGLAR